MDSGGETLVWLVGELHGGYVWFGFENLLGLYQELKERIEKKEGIPSAIIFTGILPFRQEYITRGGTKTLYLQEGVDDYDKAAVAIKPHLSRITDLIKKSSAPIALYYKLSQDDSALIRLQHDVIIDIYNYSPDGLIDIYFGYLSKIDANNVIISQTKEIIKKLSESGNGNGKIKEKEEKIRQLEEENKDYSELADVYKNLISLWLREKGGNFDIVETFKKLNKKKDPKVDSLILDLFPFESFSYDEIKRQYKEVSKKQKRIDKQKNPKRYEELEEEAKNLADLLKRASSEQISKRMKRAKEAVHESLEFPEKYTHNIPGSRELDALAQKAAELEIIRAIKHAFGRRIRLEILYDQAAFLSQDGIELSIANTMNARSRNYLLQQAKVLHSLVRNAKADIVVGMHSHKGIITWEPEKNDPYHITKMVYEISLPSMANAQMLNEQWKAHSNVYGTSPIMEVFRKEGVASGFIEVKKSSEGFSFTVFTGAYLLEKSLHILEEEKKIVENLPKPSGKELPVEERLQLANKLPSEIKPSKRQEIAIETRERYLNYKQQEGSVHKLHVLMINDAHIGTSGLGIPTQYLFRALRKYIEEHGQEIDKNATRILFSGGDNTEGGYKNIKYETNIQQLPINQYEFRRFLRGKGYSDAQVEELTEKYLAEQALKAPIANYHQQVEVYAEEVKGIIEDYAPNYVILDSGQHTGKTEPSRLIEEATGTGAVLKRMIEEKLPNARVILIPGGDKGTGKLNLDGNATAFVAHAIPERILQGFDEHDILALGADKHVFEVTQEALPSGHTFFKVIGPSSSLITGFANEIGIPTSQGIRGFLEFTVTYKAYAGHAEPLVATFKPITIEMLKKYISRPKEIEEFEDYLISARRDKDNTIKIK